MWAVQLFHSSEGFPGTGMLKLDWRIKDWKHIPQLCPWLAPFSLLVFCFLVGWGGWDMHMPCHDAQQEALEQQCGGLHDEAVQHQGEMGVVPGNSESPWSWLVKPRLSRGRCMRTTWPSRVRKGRTDTEEARMLSNALKCNFRILEALLGCWERLSQVGPEQQQQQQCPVTLLPQAPTTQWQHHCAHQSWPLPACHPCPSSPWPYCGLPDQPGRCFARKRSCLPSEVSAHVGGNVQEM